MEAFQELSEVGDIYVMGGILREYNDKHKIERLRDADLLLTSETRKDG